MKQDKKQHIFPDSVANEPAPEYGFTSKSDEERLREDIFRPDMEKLHLFTQMLRRNKTLDKATISHTR